MISSQNRLKNHKNINFYPIGLSDRKATLQFDINGSSSKLSDTGSITIDVNKLDAIISSPITFIKMDVEGGERKVIQGARDLITKFHPRLAISVYHRADDFWKIPELIFSIRKDYHIYLRHYTEGIAETVMFFIPEK